ncbi:MAG TPA: transposase [Patescibacteria group bacterium]|nr:transposase [Patescibacteria group bacterium]
MQRKIPLITGEVYHVFNRSIADYQIFNTSGDYLRMMQLLKYYQVETSRKFSDFIALKGALKVDLNIFLERTVREKEKIVQIIAYCLMPTHIHLILKQLVDEGISKYYGNILNSYSRYFNTKHDRKGPLWEGKFKNVLVDTDEQLLHLTRYLHLNPVTAFLVDRPEEWSLSSFNEYLGYPKGLKLCEYEGLIKKDPSYRKFVSDRVTYQQELAKIKTLLLEEN